MNCRRLTVSCASVILGLVMGANGNAEEGTFEATAQAPILAGDRVRARERALEDGLRQAVAQAAEGLLGPEQAAARESELKLRLYPKARSYVASYRILDEGPQPNGNFQVHVAAQVTTTKLFRDLGAPPAEAAAAAARPPPKIARAVLCLGERSGVAEQAVLGKAVTQMLAAHGIEVRALEAGCDEETALRAAVAGGAQATVLGALELKPAGPIRGTGLEGAHARARLRWIVREGLVSAEASAERDGYGQGFEQASRAAGREAAEEAARAMMARLDEGRAEPPQAGVSVRLAHLSSYQDFLALKRGLEALPGVSAVEPRRFGPEGVELAVSTRLLAPQIGAALERLEQARFIARPAGERGLVVQPAAPPELP